MEISLVFIIFFKSNVVSPVTLTRLRRVNIRRKKTQRLRGTAAVAGAVAVAVPPLCAAACAAAGRTGAPSQLSQPEGGRVAGSGRVMYSIIRL